MRLRDVIKRINKVAANGGMPDLSQEHNPWDWEILGPGPDAQGLIPGTTQLSLRGIEQWAVVDEDDPVALDESKAYLAVLIYLVDSAAPDAYGHLELSDGTSWAPIVSLDGPAIAGNAGIRSAIIPVGGDIRVVLGEPEIGLANIRLFPIVA
jgi:hypothetical protein